MTTETPSTERKTTRRKVAEVTFQPVKDITPEDWQPRRSTGGNKKPRPRTEYQLAVDALVKDSFQNKKPQFIEVPADETAIADMEKQIRQSGFYLGYGIRMGEEQPSERKGFIIMSFLATEKRKRSKPVTETATETETTSSK